LVSQLSEVLFKAKTGGVVIYVPGIHCRAPLSVAGKGTLETYLPTYICYFHFSDQDTALGFLSRSVMRYVGRRTLYLYGLAIMFTILVTVGFMGIPKDGPAVLGWISGGLLMLFVFTYDITVGPVCYCLVSEMPSTRLRIKSVVIARNCYNIASIVANFLNPPILNPTAWNLKGKGGFVWCGFCFLSFVWSYFRLPEPKGLSAGEIDVLFERGVSARNFSNIKADPFRSTNLKVAVGGEETLHITEKS
jgi:MFS transporter, SP family, general alpha glucoside:H+ symporter